jgi:hypothetical protein
LLVEEEMGKNSREERGGRKGMLISKLVISRAEAAASEMGKSGLAANELASSTSFLPQLSSHF